MATGSKEVALTMPGSARARGFSLVEVMIALAIAALVMAAAVPASVRFYEGMERRQAVRDTVALLASARERALTSGEAQDVQVRPSTGRIWLGEREQFIPSGLSLTVHGAAELNRDDIGVIRFYPDGSASGGGVDIFREDGAGTRVTVDWLMGRVTQQSLTSG